VTQGGIGFCAWRSSEVVPLAQCPVLTEPLERLVLALGQVLAERHVPGIHEVHATVGDENRGSVALIARSPTDAVAAARRLLESIPLLSGALVIRQPSCWATACEASRPGAHDILVVQDPTLSTQAPCAPGMRLRLRPDVFAQANPSANHSLVSTVLEFLRPTPSDTVLELYAGAGNFTFALAHHAGRVIAIEESAQALELARASAEEIPGLAQRLWLLSGDAVAGCHRLAQQGEKVDLALMDPPRIGAKETPRALAALRPTRIAYVSCDPATLARDIKAFLGLGYAASAAVPVDMFPQTYHVEGVVLLERTSA